MGSALLVMSGREVVRVFGSLGWEAVRQAGSHIIMTKDRELVMLSVPDPREVASRADLFIKEKPPNLHFYVRT